MVVQFKLHDFNTLKDLLLNKYLRDHINIFN